MKRVILQLMRDLIDENIDEDSRLGNPDAWDSLAHLVLISELEAKFDIFFTDEEIEKSIVFLDLLGILKRKVGEVK